MTTEKVCCPSHVGFERLQLMIRGGYMAGAHKEEKTYQDVEHVTGINVDQIRRNIPFLQYLKILTKTEAGRYRLTEEGEKLASALDVGLERKAKMTLLELCNNNEYCTKIYNFAKVPRTKEEVIGQAAIIVGVSSTQRAKMVGIRAVIDMLLWCDMLKEKNGKIVASKYKVEEALEVPVRESPKEKTEELEEIPFLPVIVSVTPDTPKEKIKETIKLVIEAYEEYTKEKKKRGEGLNDC